MVLPATISDEQQLEDVLTAPSAALVESVRGFSGSVAVVGVGGKMGGTLAVRLRRALDEAASPARVLGISRFSDQRARALLEQHGVETVTADVIDPEQVAGLPDADRVVYLVGRKFGTSGGEAETWAMNAVPPIYICRRYAGKPIVAYSTGAVYDLGPLESGGSREQDPLEPRGEYGNAAVARERLFQWASLRFGTPTCLIRLYYANDLRYGVIRDIAESVRDGRPVDLSMGFVNLIWQGDAVDQSLRAFSCTEVPAAALNITGPEIVSVRYLAQRLGELLGKPPLFSNQSGADALLGNAARAAGLFGYPEVTLDHMIRWTAAWVAAGGRGLDKPTHWEVRDGRY